MTKYLEMLANHKAKKAKPAQPPVEKKTEQFLKKILKFLNPKII